ncbi:penicillin-binding transpeptidase domain-containing protein [Clostridium tetanomorphum]|uniref:penicillin-binding transpeptidase domain-containing protein n=1 Tax=Clostridium tetanomorphum TaxID=1553 RepID=UPI000D8F139F|nr:penicillin-binding transpeptidase domain-containing protein [Clostridium tetanomorphum]SQB91673.1 penicillin-binding protein 2 [Clostridium tetanomorphum]
MKRVRCNILLLVFIFCFFVIYLRIINIQYNQADELSVIADSQYMYKESTEDLNYKLLDCNGDNLLKYDKEYKAVIVPNVFIKNNMDTDYEEFLKLLYILKSYNSKYDLTDKKYLNSSEKLYFDIDKQTFEKLKDLKGIKGFYTFECSKVNREEAWGIENLITNPKSSNDNSYKHKDSIEMYIYNKFKDNKAPSVDFNVDIDGNIKRNEDQVPNNNKNLRLTIDKQLQDDIKDILQNKYNKYEQVGVIVMDSNSGKIKAMVQKDDTLPNINIGAETLNGFFPGSIFKTIVLEGVLEQGNISTSTKFKCNGTHENKKNKREKGHGELSVKEAFVVSCNDIYSQLGIKAGFPKIYELCEKQGLLKKQ